jgi:hypothetical protein
MKTKINPIDCYAALKTKSSFVTNHCNHLLSNKENIYHHVIGWEVIRFPLIVALQEPSIQKINTKFPIAKTAILKSQPYQNYTWHTDTHRGVSINLLISTDVQSYCMFGKPKDESSFYFTELDYKENTFYLFNTQYLHQVINFTEPRYLFTIEFEQDKSDLLYSDIYNWCKEENLLC